VPSSASAPHGSTPDRASAVEPPSYGGLDAAGTRDALDYLARQGLLHAGEQIYSWTGDSSPATYVSLRSVSWDNFVIIELDRDKTLAEMDWRSAHTMLHEQAIYQHDAAQYQVERLDYENHKAYVRRVEPDYFTAALTNSRVTILDTAARHTDARGLWQHGDVEVVETVTGYKKIKFVSHENAGYGDVRLPDLQMHTTAFWWTLENPAEYLEHWSPSLLVDALRGAGIALETVSSIALMCEPRDIGRTLGSDDVNAGETWSLESGYRPTLFLYDALPGGVGLARRIFERADELFQRAAHLIASCRCRSGCPACIGASITAEPGAPGRSAPSERKSAASALLDRARLPGLVLQQRMAPSEASSSALAEIASETRCVTQPGALALKSSDRHLDPAAT